MNIFVPFHKIIILVFNFFLVLCILVFFISILQILEWINFLSSLLKGNAFFNTGNDTLSSYFNENFGPAPKKYLTFSSILTFVKFSIQFGLMLSFCLLILELIISLLSFLRLFSLIVLKAFNFFCFVRNFHKIQIFWMLFFRKAICFSNVLFDMNRLCINLK